jgi:hypothetical protein
VALENARIGFALLLRGMAEVHGAGGVDGAVAVLSSRVTAVARQYAPRFLKVKTTDLRYGVLRSMTREFSSDG